MGERVPVRIKSSGNVVTIARDEAERFAAANPNEYEIIAPPKIEVLKLEPIVEKKSAAVAADELNQEAKPEQKAETPQEPQVEVVRNKGGRPKRNA